MRRCKSLVETLAVIACFSAIADADNGTVWAYAPSFSQDPIQPYPSLKNADGSNITIENLRGTRLFGYRGCSNDDANAIGIGGGQALKSESHSLISIFSLTTTEFFGPNNAKSKIPDDRKKEIQQIFAAAQQMYAYWWSWTPPWMSWRQLWIEVRCSGNDGSGDPDNKCGDRSDPPTCPPDGRQPVGGDVQLEAYSDPEEPYSRITFCNKFFQLSSLQEAITRGKSKSVADQNNLETWNSRARVFFHEATHLDYFMSAPDASPFVSDTKFSYNYQGESYDVQGYGPYNAKILRNYVKKGRIGYYTQRNADTYAWFAVAKYIQGQINRYPSNPSPGSIKPSGPPKDQDGKLLAAEDTDPNAQGDNEDLIGTQDQPEAGQSAPGFSIPGCGDKFGQLNATQDNPDLANATNSIVLTSTSESPAPTAQTFPSPSCLPAAEGVFSVNSAFAAVGDFCIGQTDEKQPIRLTLSWDDAGGNCPQSQSPSQNAGRDCNTIFHNIANQCPESNPSLQNGGSLTWQCGYYYLGFDMGSPDVSPLTTPAT